jgi:exonuclease SbcD
VVVHNCLGHIHKHQNLTENAPHLPPIVYSGSLERIDFGEEVEPKGFCWLSLQRGASTWEFVRVKARPFHTLKIDAREEADPSAAVVEKITSRDLTGAIVRVTIQLREGQEPLLRRREVEHALTEAGVANIASISIDVERAVRLPGIGVGAESLTPAEWLERYFLAKNKPPERVQKLLRAADELLNDTDA